MISFGKKARFLHAGGFVALLLLVACEREPEAGVPEQAKELDSMLPPMLPPAEVATPAEPPSYEVGIATAAANRNRAKAKCAEKSERLRSICDAEADAAFTSAEAELQDLRGNQQ